MTRSNAGRSREGTLALLLAAALLLGVIVPGLFLLNIRGKMSANVVLMLGIVLWATFRIIQTGATGQRRLTLMCFYVFVYVFLGVQPMLSVFTGIYPYEPFLTADQAAFTIFLVAFGILAFEVGYAMSTRPAPTRTDGATRETAAPRSRPVALSILWLAVVGALGLAALSMLRYGPNIYLDIRGGVGFSSSVVRPVMSQPEWLLVIYGLRGLLATLLFIAVYLWKVRKHYDWPGRSMWRLRGLLFLLAIVNLIVSNPLSAARLWTGCLVLTMAFIAIPWKGARSFLVWCSLACLGLLLLFAGIDPRRMIAAPLLRGEEVGLASSARVIAESVGGLQADANFDAFQMIALTTRHSDNVGYSLGRQMLLPAFFWMPRAIWPDKPTGTPDIVAESFGFFNTNVAAPLWAEGYINFGMIGVPLFLGLFGRLARIGDNFLVRTARRPGAMFPTIVSSFFAANTIILLRGDLTTGTMYLQMVAGFSFAIIMLIRRRTRASAGSVAAGPGSAGPRRAPTALA